jgi:amidase
VRSRRRPPLRPGSHPQLIGSPATISERSFIRKGTPRKSPSGVDLLLAREWINDFTRRTAAWWSEGFDILVTPTLARPAPPISYFKLRLGEHPADIGRRMGEVSPFTIPWNVAGNPAISLPLHTAKEMLPVGVQLVAAY